MSSMNPRISICPLVNGGLAVLALDEVLEQHAFRRLNLLGSVARRESNVIIAERSRVHREDKERSSRQTILSKNETVCFVGSSLLGRSPKRSFTRRFCKCKL